MCVLMIKKIDFCKNKTMKKIIFAAILFRGFLLPVFGEPTYSVQMDAFVKPKAVPLNQTLLYTIQVKWTGGLNLIKIEDIEAPVFSNFEVIGTGSANKVQPGAAGSESIKEIRYTLQPKTLGMGYIEPCYLNYKEIETDQIYTLSTQRISVEVMPAVALPEEKQFPLLPILIVIGIVLVTVVGLIYFRKWRNRSDGSDEVQVILEESYLDQLKNQIDLQATNRSDAIAAVSKIYKKYLSEKFDIAALEATTQELLASLTSLELEENLIRKSEGLFQRADVIKFSGKEATQTELDEAYTTVEAVLESQLRLNQTENKELSSKNKFK